MNICIVSPSMISEETHWGGIHTHTKLLANLLLKLGHSVTLVVPGYSQNLAEELFKNINIISLNERQENVYNCHWLKNGNLIIQSLHKNNPFFCIISEGNSGYELIRFNDLKNIPIVYFVHIPSFAHIYNNWKAICGLRTFFSYFLKTFPMILHRILFREIPFVHSCARTLSVSILKTKQIRRYYFSSFKKVKTINNWVDVSFFNFDKERRDSVRSKFTILENEIVFLLIGAIWRPKGFHIAIKAFKRVSALYSNSILLVCGEGRNSEEVNLIKLVKSAGLENKVRFLGVMPYSELPSIYNAADIFLMPSLMSEGQAYTLIEAMSCGLPVIATRRGGNIETVEDAGILVRPGDTNSLAKNMVKLAENERLRQEFSEKARERVLRFFSEEVAMKRITEVLEEI